MTSWSANLCTHWLPIGICLSSTTIDVDIDVGCDYTSTPSFTLYMYFCLAFRGAAWTPASRGWSVSPCWWPACATILTTEAPITHSSRSMVQTFFNKLCLVGPGCAADLSYLNIQNWSMNLKFIILLGQYCTDLQNALLWRHALQVLHAASSTLRHASNLRATPF